MKSLDRRYPAIVRDRIQELACTLGDHAATMNMDVIFATRFLRDCENMGIDCRMQKTGRYACHASTGEIAFCFTIVRNLPNNSFVIRKHERVTHG